MNFRLVLMFVAVFPAAALPLMAQSVPEELRKPFGLTTRRGETYQNCRIQKLTPESLTVVHDAGVAKINLVLLDDTLRAKFGYDLAKASEFARKEAEHKEQLAALELERQKQLSAVAASQAELTAASPQPTSEESLAEQVETLLPSLTEPSSRKSSKRSYRSSSRRSSYYGSSCYGYSSSRIVYVYYNNTSNRRSSGACASRTSGRYSHCGTARPARLISGTSLSPSSCSSRRSSLLMSR